MDPMMMLLLMVSTVGKMANMNEPLTLTLADIKADIARNGNGSPGDDHFLTLIESLVEFTGAAQAAKEKIDAANAKMDSQNNIDNVLRPDFGGGNVSSGKHGPGCIC